MAKFYVTYSLHGTATSIVEAASEADLRAKLRAMSDEEIPAPTSWMISTATFRECSENLMADG